MSKIKCMACKWLNYPLKLNENEVDFDVFLENNC